MSNTAINETYIIEGIGEVLEFSACTAIFSNALKSCSGNTTIDLGENLIVFNGNTLATIISATTFYGDGSNLTGILTQDTFVTGGTYNENTGIATFKNNTGGTFNVTGFYTGSTDIYVTAVTFSNNLLTLYRNDGVSFGATIDDFVSLNVNGPISATTFYGDGSNLTGILTQDTFVTGGTYSNGTSIFTNNTGGTFNVSGFTTPFTGGTINGLTANTISATTYQNLPLDITVTGGTYIDGVVQFTNNTGGTFNVNGFTTPFTGGTVAGLTATTISATTYQNLPKIQNVINVGLGGNIDFTSIKLAVDSILDSSETNPYIIKVNAGLYYEDEIDLTNKPYVSIAGSSIETVIIEPNTITQHLFKIGQFNELSFMTLNNVGVGYSAIYCDNIGDYAQAHKLSFNDCDTNITVLSSTQDTKFYGEYLDFNGSYSYGTKVIASNGYLAYANIENYYNLPTGTGTTIGNHIQGSGATLSIFVGDGIGNGVSGSTNYQLSDYASLNMISTTAYNWGYGLRVLNIGGPSMFDIDSYSVVDSLVWDLSIEHSDTFGTFGGGSASHSKINNLSNDVYWAFLDVEDGEFDITRKISITFQDGTHTDASTLIFEGSTMGLFDGGVITYVSGLTFEVSAGFGYLEKTVSSEIHMRVDWPATQITLLSNSENYLYFNENEILSSSGSVPDNTNNIILGRVVTDSSTVRFIDSSPYIASHTSNLFSTFNRSALGPIYSTGSIVTENITPYHLNISSGDYYYSENNFKPSGGTDVSFVQYYKDGSSGWITTGTTEVISGYDDNSGTISPLPLSSFTKHTLYVVGEGINEKYMLVLGQTTYSTLFETEGANLPTPPNYFDDSVAPIASIFIQQGMSGITEIQDIRPVIGFKAASVSASALHANLLGLSADDHTQYLLVSGNRAMSNNLSMGGNAIVSASTYNGVTIETHASRHKNGGADEIATATPAPSEIPKADTFGKLDGWISDASASVNGLTKLSQPPASASIPIAIGVNDPRFLNSITGVTNTSSILSFPNISGATTNFSGLTLGSLTATTISATTYQNLPIDVRVTGGTYFNTGGTATFVNNTGGTFNVSGFSKMLWYAENSTSPTLSPTSVGLGSIVFGDGATSSGSDSFVFGSGATSNGNNLNVFGTNAGQDSNSPNNSNFFGVNAGKNSYQPNHSNFFGESAGESSYGPQYSNFLGYQAGLSAYQSDNSNFLGQRAGSSAQYAEYSNFFGYQVGSGITGSNNIIIGTNITLPSGTANAINLGNVLFGINTYSGITSTPNASPTIDGKIGIGIVTPLERLHVSGNTLIYGGLSAITISATTYYGIPNSTFTGGTVIGATIFTDGLTANTISAITINNITSTEIEYLSGVTSSIQPQIDAINVNVITITTSVSIDTDTTSGSFGQHGRHVKINNGANAINIQCVSTSNADFVASYEKIGSGTITFTAGVGITLTPLTGTVALSGGVGSKACLSRTSGVYYLQITNY